MFTDKHEAHRTMPDVQSVDSWWREGERVLLSLVLPLGTLVLPKVSQIMYLVCLVICSVLIEHPSAKHLCAKITRPLSHRAWEGISVQCTAMGGGRAPSLRTGPGFPGVATVEQRSR